MTVPERPEPTATVCPPRSGPRRVEWWRRWRAALADDTASQLRLLVEADWDDPEQVMAVYRGWVHAQADDAVDEGLVLGRWSS